MSEPTPPKAQLERSLPCLDWPVRAVRILPRLRTAFAGAKIARLALLEGAPVENSSRGDNSRVAHDLTLECEDVNGGRVRVGIYLTDLGVFAGRIDEDPDVPPAASRSELGPPGVVD